MLWRRRKSGEHDLDRELRSHLDLESEEQRQAGLAPDPARYAAQRAFGNAADWSGYSKGNQGSLVRQVP